MEYLTAEVVSWGRAQPPLWVHLLSALLLLPSPAPKGCRAMSPARPAPGVTAGDAGDPWPHCRQGSRSRQEQGPAVPAVPWEKWGLVQTKRCFQKAEINNTNPNLKLY